MTIEFKIDEFELAEPNDEGADFECKGRQVTVSCDGKVAVLPFFPDENTHGIGWLLLQQRDEGELDAEVPDEGPIDLEEADGVLIGFENPRSIDVFLEALSALQEKFEGGSRWRPLADVIEERRRQDAQWGGPEHDDDHAAGDWFGFIEKQMMKTTAPRRERFVKIAALAVAAIEALDRAKDKADEEVEEQFKASVAEEIFKKPVSLELSSRGFGEVKHPGHCPAPERDDVHFPEATLEEGEFKELDGIVSNPPSVEELELEYMNMSPEERRKRQMNPITKKPGTPWGNSTQ